MNAEEEMSDASANVREHGLTVGNLIDRIEQLESKLASAKVREAALIVSQEHLQDRINELEKAFEVARCYALEFTGWRKKDCDIDTYAQIVTDEEEMFSIQVKA